MSKTTILHLLLLAATATSLPTIYLTRSEPGKCFFPVFQKQLCDPQHHNVVNYLDIFDIYNSQKAKVVDVRSQRPPKCLNSLVNLNKGAWTIGGFPEEKELKVRIAKSDFRFQNGWESIAATDEERPVLFEFAGVEWDSERGAVGSGRSAWCEVKKWDVEGWSCKPDQLVDPRARQMTCFFPC